MIYSVELTYYPANEGEKWHASFVFSNQPKVKGCPLGRGNSPKQAVRDLLTRTYDYGAGPLLDMSDVDPFPKMDDIETLKQWDFVRQLENLGVY